MITNYRKVETMKTKVKAARLLGVQVENLVMKPRNIGRFIDGLEALYHLEKLLPFRIQPEIGRYQSDNMLEVWRMVKRMRAKEGKKY